MSMLWRSVAALSTGLMVAAAPPAAAPQTTPQNPPVFRSGVDLVTVDVTVVDRQGRPVTGLTAEDFAVLLDGKRHAVRALDYLAFGPTPGAPAGGEPPARATTRAAPVQSRGGRVILLVVDDLSARPAQMIGLRISAQRMLDTLDLGDLVGVATTSGLGPVVSPTRDRAAVRAALESKGVMGRNDDSTAPIYVSIPEAIDINRTLTNVLMNDNRYLSNDHSTYGRVVRRECSHADAVSNGAGREEDHDATCPSLVIKAAAQLGQSLVARAAAQLAAYAHFIDALRVAPAPRVIIALSAGVALGVDRGSVAELDPVSLAAAKAGVQLYALAETSDWSDAGEVGFDRPAAQREEEAFLASGVQTVATAAGGEAFKVVGQADRFFARIVAETSGMYQLGVEAPALPQTSEFVNVSVSVSRPGVTVRTRGRALTPSAKPEPAAPPHVEAALQARIAQGGAAFGVPIAMTSTLRRDPDNARQVQLGVNAEVPAAVAGPLLTMFAVVDDRGRIVQQGSKPVQAKLTQDYHVSVPVPLASGDYRVRFAVADANGNIGSLEEPVRAVLTHLGTCDVSDVSTSWSDAEGASHALTLETLPDGATSLRVSLELYPDVSAALLDLSVRLSLVREGDTDPLVERDLAPSGTGATRIVTASLPASQLPSGAYLLRATVIESGAVMGTVSAVIKKK